MNEDVGIHQKISTDSRGLISLNGRDERLEKEREMIIPPEDAAEREARARISKTIRTTAMEGNEQG